MCSPVHLLNLFSTNQPEQGAGFNASSVWLDPGVDHPLAGGQVFLEHLDWIHSSHQHATAELLGAETRPALAKVIRFRSGGSRPAVALKVTAAIEITTELHGCFVTLNGHQKKAGVSPLQAWMELSLQYTP